jgi:hypothetical protein
MADYSCSRGEVQQESLEEDLLSQLRREIAGETPGGGATEHEEKTFSQPGVGALVTLLRTQKGNRSGRHFAGENSEFAENDANRTALLFSML